MESEIILMLLKLLINFTYTLDQLRKWNVFFFSWNSNEKIITKKYVYFLKMTSEKKNFLESRWNSGNGLLSDFYLGTITINILHHIKPSQLICSANQLTDFYMIGNTGHEFVNGLS